MVPIPFFMGVNASFFGILLWVSGEQIGWSFGFGLHVSLYFLTGSILVCSEHIWYHWFKT